MEHSLVHLVETAAWFFVVVFAFAVVGVVATIRWIVGLLTRGEQAVASGVESVERKL